jgi:hypothetical protein
MLRSLAMLGVLLAIAPMRPETSKIKRSPKRPVTLETVLSCADDPLLGDVFKTDHFTAVQLNAVLMILMKFKKMPDANYVDFRSRGFVTSSTDDSAFRIMPTNPLSGDTIAEAKLTFCHDSPTAHYDKANYKSVPSDIDINGEGWALSPNEIFVHADQFHFDSGVFENSSDIFFTATKGRVSIQFVCKSDGLKFYRAIYLPSD